VYQVAYLLLIKFVCITPVSEIDFKENIYVSLVRKIDQISYHKILESTT